MAGPGIVIGRKKEREVLLRALRTKHSELVAVYGRRRIGKTYLVRSVYKDHLCLEWSGMHRGTYKDQLKNFHAALSERSKNWPVPADWMEAFAQLGRYL